MSATEQITRDRDRRPHRRLFRSRQHRIIAGVCGGIADYLGWSPTRVRILTLLSFLLPGPQILVYLVIWLLVPSEPRYAYQPI